MRDSYSCSLRHRPHENVTDVTITNESAGHEKVGRNIFFPTKVKMQRLTMQDKPMTDVTIIDILWRVYTE